jgi:hypothetical protein
MLAEQETATVHPAAAQVCERHDQITACAFPDFRNWMGDWDTVARSVMRRTPTHSPLFIRQRVFITGRVLNTITPQAPMAEWTADDRRAGTPEPISVNTDWGSGQSELELAAGVARRLVTGTPQKPDIMPVCGAQAVTVLWLAGQADESAFQALQRMLANGSGAVVLTPAEFGTGFAITHRDGMVALDALKRPIPESAAVLAKNWATLTDPGTSTERAAELFGVAAPWGSPAVGGRC